MRKNVLAAALMLAVALGSTSIGAVASSGTTILGRVLETTGGLPVAGARVELDRGDALVAKTTTSADGSYTFADEGPGLYTVVISANGYQTTRSQDLYVIGGLATVSVTTAIGRDVAGLKTIGTVTASAHGALQTTATITEHIAPSVLQEQDYMRIGDVLSTTPFVNGSTSSSLGDDLGISIRGFDPSETATLLDGHPIGPIGAFGGGFDYQLSPFFGLSSVDVTLGSGATGLYGISTIAGAVNFQTINPTRDAHTSFEQGAGSLGHLLSGFQTTGTRGKLGYAAAYAVQGTDGELVGSILQRGLLTSPGGNCPAGVNSIPSVAAADVAGCTYPVDGNYIMRNAAGKLTYQFDSKTALLLSTYNATMWANSTGNGDTDFLPYQDVLYNANHILAGEGGTDTQTLASGTSVSCNNGFVVANDSSAGYSCMTPAQFATTFSGPAGGGLGRWHAGRNQDYHARLTRTIGAGSLVLDGFVDNYGFLNVKGPNGKWHDDIYRTHGALISDEYGGERNDFSFGVFLQHQAHLTTVSIPQNYQEYDLSTSSYFLSDIYTPSKQFQVFGNLWLQRSHSTGTSNFNPRLSFVFRPNPSDVVRLTGGRSSSEPDPSLLFGGFTFDGSPASLNPVCGPGDLNSIGSGSSPILKPEQANDIELYAGHRFPNQAVVSADIYDAVETNPLVGGIFPLSVVPAGQLPNAAALQPFLDKIAVTCGKVDASVLGVNSTFNAGQATYRGISLSATLPIIRNLKANGDYNIQSAYYSGINDNILSSNHQLINGSQFPSLPLRTANLGFGYSNPVSGLQGRIDAHYIGAPNSFNRVPYTFANANISKTFGSSTLNLGVSNLFNSIYQQYGYVGLGVFHPENQFGGDANSFDQGSEQYGLAARQVWLTFTTKI